MIRWQWIRIVWKIRGFIIIPKRALSVKLKVADKVLGAAEISRTLQRNADFYGLPVGNIFWDGHYFDLKREVVLYFEFTIFAARDQ